MENRFNPSLREELGSGLMQKQSNLAGTCSCRLFDSANYFLMADDSLGILLSDPRVGRFPSTWVLIALCCATLRES
jgi:hypothetical protein